MCTARDCGLYFSNPSALAQHKNIEHGQAARRRSAAPPGPSSLRGIPGRRDISVPAQLPAAQEKEFSDNERLGKDADDYEPSSGDDLDPHEVQRVSDACDSANYNLNLEVPFASTSPPRGLPYLGPAPAGHMCAATTTAASVSRTGTQTL